MASIGESSSTPMECTTEKPVVVRVKRKCSQSRLDAFWLEINERPLKRPLLDFQKLSIDAESAHGRVEELKKKKKVFVHHVETVSSSEATVDILQSFVPHSGDAIGGIPESEKRKQMLENDHKQEELFPKGTNQDTLAQNAHFEQIRRTNMGNKEASHGKAIQEICHFYDIVRVDIEERSNEMQEDLSLEDKRLLSSYLPLLREFIPSAADDIESDIHDYLSKPGVANNISCHKHCMMDSSFCTSSTDGYVYDYYTVSNAMELDDDESLSPFPLVTVEEEDFYDGPDDELEYESDDSNAEAHPHNEYPDETSHEEDEEDSEESSDVLEDDDGDDDASRNSSELKELRHTLRADEIYDGDDTFDYEDDDSNDDEEDWR